MMSELVRVEYIDRNGNLRHDRLSYYVKIGFMLFGENFINLPFKIDTGSVCTVIGLSNPGIKDLSDKILSKGKIVPSVYSATG